MLQAIILAIIQGITEFIPVSSSAHLVIFPALMGWQDQGLLFDVILHLGTLAALCAYFRRDLYGLLFNKQERVFGLGYFMGNCSCWFGGINFS